MEESYKYLSNTVFAIGFGLMYPFSTICAKAIVDQETKFGSPFIAFLVFIIGFFLVIFGFFYLKYQEAKKF